MDQSWIGGIVCFSDFSTGQMFCILKIIFVHTNVEHLDQVPDQSSMDQSWIGGIVGTDKYLIESSIIPPSMLYVLAGGAHVAGRVPGQVDLAARRAEGGQYVLDHRHVGHVIHHVTVTRGLQTTWVSVARWNTLGFTSVPLLSGYKSL